MSRSTPLRGSESEFLNALAAWQPIAHVCDMDDEDERKSQGEGASQTTPPSSGFRRRAGPSSRAASSARAASAAAAASASSAASDIASSSSTRFFLYLERSPSSPSCLELTVSNIHASWVLMLDYASMRRHREQLGIANVGWRDVLNMIKQAFESKKKISVRKGEATSNGIDEDDTSAGIPLTVLLRYNIGSEVELEGKFTLQQVHDGETSSSSSIFTTPLSNHQRSLSHLLFGVFDATRSAESSALKPLQTQLAQQHGELIAARAELNSLRAKVASLEMERSNWLSGGGASGTSGSLDASQLAAAAAGVDGGLASSPTAATKRKQPVKKNMSVLNPNVKRRKLGGFKIE